MKKLLVVSLLPVLFVFLVTAAFAADEPAKAAEPVKTTQPVKTAEEAAKNASGEATKNTGCGLGSMLWKNRADDSSLSQASQATTNGIGSQTIAISMGTSHCSQPVTFVRNDRLNEFVVANMDNLAKNIAMGRGEMLDTFVELMQIPAEKRPEFCRKLQINFANIFTSEHVQLANVVDNVVTVSAAN